MRSCLAEKHQVINKKSIEIIAHVLLLFQVVTKGREVMKTSSKQAACLFEKVN